MDECQETYSQQQDIPIQQAPPQFEYEECPHCQRQFFMGKLQYHLKFCKSDSPMLKSHLKAAKIKQGASRLRDHMPSQRQRLTPTSQAKIPHLLHEKHTAKQVNQPPGTPVNPQESVNPKSSTDVNFNGRGDREGLTLPQIKRTPQNIGRTRTPFNDAYKIKIRDELRCFRKAEEIKKVQCTSCGRTFSKQASLRHIPVCSALREKAERSIALRKKPKNVNFSAVGSSLGRMSPASPLKKEKSLDAPKQQQASIFQVSPINQ